MKFPSELRAVIHIFSSCDELKAKALRYVDVKTQSIYWDGIFRQDFGSGHRAAVYWARCILWDAVDSCNPFGLSHSMEASLKKVVLEALAIRWGLSLGGDSDV